MSSSSLFSLTPGARAARRGQFGVRPGQADFAQMSMIDLGDQLQKNPWLRSLFGPDMQIKFAGGDGKISIEISVAP